MHPQLRQFLIANGLRADATEQQAWEFYTQLQADGIMYNGPERAEAPQGGAEGAAGTDGAQAAQRSAAGARQHGDDDVPPPAQQPVGLTADDVRHQVNLTIQNNREIEDICAVAGMGVDQARGYIDEGLTVDQVRQRVFDHMRANNISFGAGAQQGLELGTEDGDKFRSAVVDGLALRSGRRLENPAPGATQFRGQRLSDIAGECLQRAGINTRRMNPEEISRRALSPHSSSDFPLLMSNVANRNLQAAYTEAPSTYRQWVGVGDASDFKAIHAITLSGSPDLEDLGENGEIKTAQLAEKGESYAVTTKAIKIPFTRVMIINDDLRAFTRTPTLIGMAAKRLENRMVYALLLSNPTMTDGVALFHADHKNLGAAGDINSTTLGAARAAMRQQTGMKGEVIDVMPAFLLAGTKEETTADILLRSAALPNAEMSSGVYNPWSGKLTPVTDPLLDVTGIEDPFYLVAHPNQAAIIEVSWLLGQESPFVDDEVEFGTGNINYVCRHDFGCGVADHVGGYKVPRS